MFTSKRCDTLNAPRHNRAKIYYTTEKLTVFTCSQVFAFGVWLGMYVNHEFTIAVITVIFALCRDFRQLPWFYVTAVIITKYVQFRLPNGQFCLNICSAFSFLSAHSRIINPASLLGSSRPTCIQNDGLTHGCTAQSQTGTAGDIACDHKHAADRAGKSVHSMGRGQVTKTLRYCRRVGGFRSERQRCGSIVPT